MVSSLISIAFLMPSVALALNDWNVPCLDGQCSYDVSNGTVSGSMSINGSSSAISDITSAAGWTILECDPNSMAQDIRVVCTGNTTSCNHLYTGGAVGTLVRLPENCAKMPFARIANEWTSENQTIPSDVATSSRRRDGTAPPSVRGISIDTKWAAIDPSKNGQVSLTIQGSTSAGLPLQSHTRRHSERGIFGDIASDISDATSFNDTDSKQSPINIDQSFPIFDKSISCPAAGKLPAFTGEVKIDAEAKVNGSVDYGLTAQGTVIPPDLKKFALFANFDAKLDGILTMDATATATFDTGKISVFTVGLPGLDFPGILTLGPSFNIDVEGIATIDTDINMTVDLAYNINNGSLTFPPDQGSSSGSFAPADTNLQLSVSPSVASSASVEAHVIPTLEFGINALDGLASATVDLDLDTSAKLTLSLNAGASASKSSNGTSSSSEQFSGCVDVSSTLAVNAGADASFFDLFDKSTSVTLFSKTFDLFQKCFGSGSNTSSSSSSYASSTYSPSTYSPSSYSSSSYYRRKHARDIVRRGLACPLGDVTKAASVADEVIKGSSIKAK